LVGGPDVWEVIQTIDSHPGGTATVPATAELLNLTERQVRAAIDYRTTNPEEIDTRIKLNAQARQSWGDLSKLVAATTAEHQMLRLTSTDELFGETFRKMLATQAEVPHEILAALPEDQPLHVGVRAAGYPEVADRLEKLSKLIAQEREADVA